MDFALPEIGEGVYEAELISWAVKPGDVVKPGDTLLEVMTDKATMEVPSPFAGRIGALLAEPGTKVKIGQIVLAYDKTDQASAPALAARPTTVTTVQASNGSVSTRIASANRGSVKAAPSVRYLARKLGIDLTAIAGSGPEGRILLDDVTTRAQPLERSSVSTGKPVEARPDYGRPGTRIKLQGLRRRIAEHMVHAKHTIPHYSYIDECDVTDLVKMRESLRQTMAEKGVKLTYLAFAVKAVTFALKEVPLVNSSFDEASGEIVLHDGYHIGIAVATPGGLIVPVVRDADKKDLTTVASEIERLGAEARSGKIRRDDLGGGTFTVSSVGNLGGLISTPIVNHPEVGILGLGKIVRRPVYDEAGQIRPADLLYLSFSFDHRIVDGAVGAVFGNAVLASLRQPARLLLPV